MNELVADNDATTSELAALPDTFDHIQAGRLACAEAKIRDMRIQIERTETYADDIRRQLQDRLSLESAAEGTNEHLQINLQRAIRHVAKLESELEATQSSHAQLAAELAGIKEAHAQEIRVVRFELGAAQETVTHHELVTEQLASDLLETRGFRDQLELSLALTEKETQSQIESLESENRRLRDELEHQKEQLQNKSEAVNSLLSELATKSHQIDAIDEIEEVIDELDDRMSECISDRSRRERGRVSRVLIGTVDGQELRFPLFKDRLTIGRADQNDIQLKASCISRRHAVIVSDQDTTRVIDWGSRNGVFINTERVTEHFLNNGDSVAIGTAKFRYEERSKRDA